MSNRITSREKMGLSLAFVALVVGIILAVMFGNEVLDYVLEQLGFNEDFTPQQLPTI